MVSEVLVVLFLFTNPLLLGVIEDTFSACYLRRGHALLYSLPVFLFLLVFGCFLRSKFLHVTN